MPKKRGKGGRSTRTTKTAGKNPRVNPDGSGDAAPPKTGAKQAASSRDGSTATTTLVKSKRTVPSSAPRWAEGSVKPAGRRQAPVSPALRRVELDVSATQAVETEGSFAAKFAKAARKLRGGVTIGIDRNLQVHVIESAFEKVLDVSTNAYPHGTKAPFADRLDDPRLLDLEETVKRFMVDSKTKGVTAAARARFAAIVLGVSAKRSEQVDRVADTALLGLWARLRGRATDDENLPPQLVALLQAAARAWRSTSDADFWRSLAVTAQRPPEDTPEGFLREQAAWMGLVADLSAEDDGKPPWKWASAAEKADLVDTLIAVGTAAPHPVQAILKRLSTLRRGPDALPRAIAAELAQLAIAALPGVTKAESNRRDVLRIKERPPGPDATTEAQAIHEAREALRSTAHSLVEKYQGLRDKLHAGLFRSKLSTLYAHMKEQLRLEQLRLSQAPRRDDDDEPQPSGEERYREFMDTLGPLDRALTEALDAWSAAIGSGATDPATFVELAREAQATIEGILWNMKDRGYGMTSIEESFVGTAVKELAVELGLQAGEVLTGRVQAAADPLAGLRRSLTDLRGDHLLVGELTARAGTRPKVAEGVRWVLRSTALPAPWVTELSEAAQAFDTASGMEPIDPAALAMAADALLLVGSSALGKVRALPVTNANRRAITDAVAALYSGAADRLEEEPRGQGADLLGSRIAQLHGAIPTLRLPARGVGLDRFWSEQKAAALALLPSAEAKELTSAMDLGLAKELERFTALAATGDATAIEAQAWSVARLLSAYKAAVPKVPKGQAGKQPSAEQVAARTQLHAALDGIALSVVRQLPSPAPANAGQDG
jgi:hypothetical protein